MAEKQYFYGLGRRKEAVAQVRLYPQGTGVCTINDKAVVLADQVYVAPLKLIGQLGSVDVSVHVNGGGFAGQAGAILLGIARALVALDETNKTTLKKAGYLTRDPRERERKKFGLKSARRRPQWSKR